MDSEEQNIELTDKNAKSKKQQVTAGNGDRLTYTTEAAEESPLLHTQVPVSNGEKHPLVDAAVTKEDSISLSISDKTPTNEQTSTVCRLKRELNEVVIWKIRLWMVIVLIFLLIFAVIVVSLALCSVIHEDVDDKYDPASFEMSRDFNGSFRLTNQIFTANLSPISNQSQALSTQLQKQLCDLYSSSPALGRYFSSAEIRAFRNGSVVAEYWLKFLMPLEYYQLEKFTLSREVVYNVLRQYLYDQEQENHEPLYIDPASLNMEVADGAVSQQ